MAAKKVCGNLPAGEQYDCYKSEAIKRTNPEVCRLTGIWIDDMCLQMVYEAADDPSICERIYLQGVVPNCLEYYARHTPAQVMP